jgi:ectoine hydroxylase-related dioxygenase (phytanoyl-CoA dioxygenase family)
MMTLIAERPEKPSPQVTSEDVEQFTSNGYAIARGLFAPDEVAEIRDAFMAQADMGSVPGLFDASRISGSNDPLARYPRMMHPHRHPGLPVGPLSMRYMLDRRIEAYLTAFFGEPVVAAQSMFYFKPAGARGQSLHQDNFYLRVAPLTCMAAWVAIDDVDEDNGGLFVVPGTQDIAIACPEKADPTISFTTEYVAPPEGTKPIPVIMKAGDCLFFNGSLIHGSYPNTSADRFRRSFICHYLPASSTEISAGYKPLFAFDGTVVGDEIGNATGGGPCGTDGGLLTVFH